MIGIEHVYMVKGRHGILLPPLGVCFSANLTLVPVTPIHVHVGGTCTCIVCTAIWVS